ncbi:hypothetical protein UCDDA912_g07635 [Diaporthe ampelina]|uniref:Uncharacterized protein n=1 Tax=Diaporthe ampelina TaxID=1214573 RepID=A0A0G2FE50_9PEZI|nr:hypothetical protein UCDDA912_g07635 [Diaporthe ampelina]
MEMPPYFISDLEAARQELVDFTRRVRSVYIETLVADSNPILRQTFEAAMLFATFGQGELVSDALDCWVAARLIEAQFRVFNGGAMIGMEHVDEAGHPFDGFTPVTPIMDSQLDDMVIRNLIRPFSSMYEDELYWCYQLLVSDWRGNIPYEAGEIDDFREEDFLSSSTT